MRSFQIWWHMSLCQMETSGWFSMGKRLLSSVSPFEQSDPFCRSRKCYQWLTFSSRYLPLCSSEALVLRAHWNSRRLKYRCLASTSWVCHFLGRWHNLAHILHSEYRENGEVTTKQDKVFTLWELKDLSQTYEKTESLARIGRTDYDSLSSCWSQKVIPSLTSYLHLVSVQDWTRLISTLISSSTSSRGEISTMSMSSSTSTWSFCFLPYTSGADLSRHWILINDPHLENVQNK